MAQEQHDSDTRVERSTVSRIVTDCNGVFVLELGGNGNIGVATCINLCLSMTVAPHRVLYFVAIRCTVVTVQVLINKNHSNAAAAHATDTTRTISNATNTETTVAFSAQNTNHGGHM